MDSKKPSSQKASPNLAMSMRDPKSKANIHALMNGLFDDDL